jgi:hypothetical protein
MKNILSLTIWFSFSLVSFCNAQDPSKKEKPREKYKMEQEKEDHENSKKLKELCDCCENLCPKKSPQNSNGKALSLWAGLGTAYNEYQFNYSVTHPDPLTYKLHKKGTRFPGIIVTAATVRPFFKKAGCIKDFGIFLGYTVFSDHIGSGLLGVGYIPSKWGLDSHFMIAFGVQGGVNATYFRQGYNYETAIPNTLTVDEITQTRFLSNRWQDYSPFVVLCYRP